MNRPIRIAARISSNQYRTKVPDLDLALRFPSQPQSGFRHLCLFTGIRKLTSLSIILRRTRWSLLPHCGQNGIGLSPLMMVC
jgi:hypothetical protein